MSRRPGTAASNSLNGGPFNVSIMNLLREFALTGTTPPYAVPTTFGRFEVLHQVGAGVLGPVLLARDPERTKSIAIKVFLLEVTPDQAAELAKQLGLLARANLAHPSIIAPFEAGVDGAITYLAEDYFAADSLDAAIRQYGPAPASQAIRILAAVADALDFAAAVGVHHGALHPRDVLVTPDDTRLTGLGVGRALEAVGLRAPMRRPYVAPERVQREGWDAHADIYSLGVLARELFGGRSKPDAPGGPRLPDDQVERLQPVLARATSARPVDRFSTCLEFIEAVQDAITGAPCRATAVPVPAAGQPARAARARQPTHDLLLPLEGDESDEIEVRGGGRLRLEDAGTIPDLPMAVDRPPVGAEPVASLPDLDLQSRSAGGKHPADAFDLSDLDSHLMAEPGSFADELATEQAEEPAQAAMFEGAAGMSIAGPRTAELGGPIDLPPPEADAGQPERFADVFTSTPEPTTEEPTVVAPTPVETPWVADEPPRADLPAPRQSRAAALVAMLVVGLIVGAVAGYLVGVRRGTPSAPPPVTQLAPAPALANAPSATLPAARTATPTTQPPAAQPAAGTSPAPRATTTAGSSAAVAATGVLVVRSTPRGASVAINGRARGATPLRVRNLAPGRYAVRVSRRGYTTEEREVVVSAERPSTVTFSLDRASRAQPASRKGSFGSLAVDSLPAGARVFVDGRLVGTTPIANARVAAGSHVVRVDRTGFRPWTSPIQIVTDQRLRVTASLEREPK